MRDMSWVHNPALKDIHPEKMKIMTELINNTEGKPIAQSIPHLMQANKLLSGHNLSFTEEETLLIMEILTKDMTPAERQNLAKAKGMFQQRFKKNN